ncbi:hypothetical protein [Azospirillum doebereinerae]|nr:hypothetical protein [Azospirillum doebereinerae]
MSLNLRRSWMEGEPVAALYQADANIASSGGAPEARVTMGKRRLF